MTKKTVGTLLVVLSVGMNIAFLSTWLVHRILQRDSGCSGIADECPMHVLLNATEPQSREMESRLAAFRESSEPLCLEIRRYRLDLLDLMAMPNPDSTAIYAKQEQLIARQRQMQEKVIENLMGLSSKLTPEQRERFFDLLRERSKNSSPGPMMMGMGDGGR
jgi:Spy/CpxP family protein refolding chaperone